jgi:hypothetical protein
LRCVWCGCRMANWFKMAHSKESALFKYFCSATSAAMFQLLPGEHERVEQHLRALQMDEAHIARVPRKYWRRYCRCT